MIRSLQNAVRIAVRNTLVTAQPSSLVKHVSVRPVHADMPSAPPRLITDAAPYFGRPTATLAHIFGQVSNRRWLSSRAVLLDSSPSAMSAPPKSKDPRDIPISDALKLIANLMGRNFEVDISQALPGNVNSLADLLNLGKDDWAIIEKSIGYSPERQPYIMAAGHLKFALAKLWELRHKEGRPAELDSIQIGKTIRVLSTERPMAGYLYDCRRDEISDTELVVCSTLQLESYLDMEESKYLMLLSPLEIGVVHKPRTYNGLVDGGVYIPSSSSLEWTEGLEKYIKKGISVMEVDVQKAVVAAKGPTARALAPLHVKRHLKLKVLDRDTKSETYMQLVDRHWEIDVLVSHDGGITIGECKHSVTCSKVISFVRSYKHLEEAIKLKKVEVNGEPYTELLDKWPTDSAKVELVMAAAHDWDTPDGSGMTPRMQAEELGVKIIEHNGAEWIYAR